MYADVFDDAHASYNDYNPSEMEQVHRQMIQYAASAAYALRVPRITPC